MIDLSMIGLYTKATLALNVKWVYTKTLFNMYLAWFENQVIFLTILALWWRYSSTFRTHKRVNLPSYISPSHILSIKRGSERKVHASTVHVFKSEFTEANNTDQNSCHGFT